MNDRSINSPPFDGGDAQRAEGVCELIEFKECDPRFETLLLLPDWSDELFEELMKGVPAEIYIEVYTVLRFKLFKKRNELYNPLINRNFK